MRYAAARKAMTDEQPATDLPALFGMLAEGRAAALEPIYEALADDVHGVALWRTGSTADAADVLQEVFVRLAGAGPRLRRVRNPRAYVLRMAHRAAVDVHRRRKRRGEGTIDEARYVQASTPTAERDLDAGRVARLLDELPAEQREVIYLRTFAGCSFAEAARATGVPTFTAASRYRLGLERLRRLLGVKS
jgi:RNA polymerase sigma-70 factor (ECF subfamily)